MQAVENGGTHYVLSLYGFTSMSARLHECLEEAHGVLATMAKDERMRDGLTTLAKKMVCAACRADRPH